MVLWQEIAGMSRAVINVTRDKERIVSAWRLQRSDHSAWSFAGNSLFKQKLQKWQIFRSDCCTTRGANITNVDQELESAVVAVVGGHSEFTCPSIQLNEELRLLLSGKRSVSDNTVGNMLHAIFVLNNLNNFQALSWSSSTTQFARVKEARCIHANWLSAFGVHRREWKLVDKVLVYGRSRRGPRAFRMVDARPSHHTSKYLQYPNTQFGFSKQSFQEGGYRHENSNFFSTKAQMTCWNVEWFSSSTMHHLTLAAELSFRYQPAYSPFFKPVWGIFLCLEEFIQTADA